MEYTQTDLPPISRLLSLSVALCIGLAMTPAVYWLTLVGFVSWRLGLIVAERITQ